MGSWGFCRTRARSNERSVPLGGVGWWCGKSALSGAGVTWDLTYWPFYVKVVSAFRDFGAALLVSTCSC